MSEYTGKSMEEERDYQILEIFKSFSDLIDHDKHTIHIESSIDELRGMIEIIHSDNTGNNNHE